MEAVKGSKLVYLYRVHDNAATEDGATLAFTTENSRSVSKDADTTVTKDGTVRTPSQAEIEISATSMLAQNDTLIDKLEDAMLSDKLMDIWEANLDDPKDGTYSLTSDTAIVEGKTYFTRSGTSGSYTYTAVTTPDAASLSSYYELAATKFGGRYYQGYLTSFEKTSSADGYVECSLTFGINGIGAKGNVTVDAASQEIAAYVFADTPRTS